MFHFASNRKRITEVTFTVYKNEFEDEYVASTSKKPIINGGYPLTLFDGQGKEKEYNGLPFSNDVFLPMPFYSCQKFETDLTDKSVNADGKKLQELITPIDKCRPCLPFKGGKRDGGIQYCDQPPKL